MFLTRNKLIKWRGRCKRLVRARGRPREYLTKRLDDFHAIQGGQCQLIGIVSSRPAMMSLLDCA